QPVGEARIMAVRSEPACPPRSEPVGGPLRAPRPTDANRMTTIEPPTTDALTELPMLLSEETAVRAVIDRAPVVAVPEPARALYLAALTPVTTPRPVLVAVPTAAEAQRVAPDLTPHPRPHAGVQHLPAPYAPP